MLSHAWLVNSKPTGISYPAYKYKDVRPELRARMRAEWNAPVRWPLYLVLFAVVAADGAGGQDLLPGAPVMAAYLAPPHRLRVPHRARRAVPAVRPVLRRDGPRRHRPQGGGRAGAAGGLRAMEDQPRLRQAAVRQPGLRGLRPAPLHRYAARRALSPHAHLRFRPQRRRRLRRSPAACGKARDRASA